MRILVTDAGREEIRNISTTPNHSRIVLKNNKSTPSIMKKDTSDTLPNLKKSPVKKINIKQPNKGFITAVTDLYERSPPTPRRVKNSVQNKSRNVQLEFFTKKNVSIKEILNPNAYQNMIKKMKDQMRVERLNSRVDASNFRTDSVRENLKKRKISDLDAVLCTSKIGTDKPNLIKYIQTKEDLNPIMLKTLTRLTERELNHEEKLAHILLIKKEKDDLMHQVMRDRMRNRYRHYPKSINEIKEDMKYTTQIISKYPKENRKKRYAEALETMEKKYWNKFDYNRLLKTSQRTLSPPVVSDTKKFLLV